MSYAGNGHGARSDSLGPLSGRPDMQWRNTLERGMGSCLESTLGHLWTARAAQADVQSRRHIGPHCGQCDSVACFPSVLKLPNAAQGQTKSLAFRAFLLLETAQELPRG